LGPWRVEILRWSALSPGHQRDVLKLAGELSGEWWGGGQVQFEKSHAAFDFMARLRWLGQYCRLIDTVGLPVMH
jgi:hypothetical protein